MNLTSQSAVPSSPTPGESAFALRTNQFLHRAGIAAESWYDAAGAWLPATQPHGVRERYWICVALFETGRRELANAVIRAGDTHRSHMGRENVSSFDIFHSNIACVLLKKYRQLMAADVIESLEYLVREAFAFQAGNRRPDYQFHGYNDNMPAKASMGLILGGEMLGNADAVEHGLWNLRQCRAMLTRRGAISEWNSPTYSAATIVPISEIAEHARNAGAREIALDIEARLWLDLAARFHPETGVIAGPYARAYTIDLIAHLSCVSQLLWFVLGDIVKPSPMELFNPDSGLVLHHMGDVPFNVSQVCWFAGCACHIPARALDMFTRKSYPFQAMAMAETGDGAPDYPARPVRIETYLERDYTVGAANTPFLNGNQCASYLATYKRAAEVRSFRDIGVVFHKITINGEVPGTIKSPPPENGRSYANSGEQDNLESHANVIAIQSGPSVLAVTHPELLLGGFEEITAPRELTRLDEMVIFPSHFGGAEEIRIGGRAVESWAGEVAHGEWVGCRRGRLLIAIRPLAYSADAGGVRIGLERINRYEVLRSTFYEGPARTFTRSELRRMFGGFVAEHASIDEYPSLAAFMEELGGARFTDYVWTTRRVRYRRPESKARPALEVELSWSPGSTAPRYAAVNGRPVSQDVRVKIDGLAEADFPFLTQPGVSVPAYFPWERVEADWGTGIVRGAIGDREY